MQRASRHHASQGRSSPRLILAFAALLALAGCGSEVAAGLDEAQTDEVLGALQEAGIAAERERMEGQDPTYRVLVARDQWPAAFAALRERGLPRRGAEGFDAMLDDGALVPSATAERARYAAAVAGELARSIEAMNGVVRARVHVALPDSSARLLDDGPAHARASVLVTRRAGVAIDERGIRALVAGAVDELDPRNVAIVATSAPRPRAHSALTRIGPMVVTTASAGALKAILAGSFALNLALAVVLVLMRVRRRAGVVRTADERKYA